MHLAPPDLHLARHARLREQMLALPLDALLVSSGANLAYLTGVFASAGALLVTPDHLTLVIDGRYAEAARQRQADLPGLALALVPSSISYEETVAAEIGRLGAVRVGFDPDHLTVRQHQDLVSHVGAAAALVPAEGLVENLRVCKDPWEIATLQEAAMRLSDAAKCIIPKVLADVSEREVAARIDQELRRVGFDKPAFDTIVAAGPNAARPHHRAGDRIIERGDLVLLDFGGVLHGYSVDLSRTVVPGGAGARERRLLEQVAEAQAAGFAAIAPGRPVAAVDAAARGLLEGKGLGEAFSHGTGHGLGLELHERPRVNRPREGQPAETIEAGMVFTLEPGAYLAGWGGVRIEDDVLVTTDGGLWLTDVPRLM